ncbi:MAG: TorF family putative porin [Pseudomonadota bacterium]
MKYLTKNLTLAAAITLAMATLGAGLARAEDAKPEAKPDNEISFNAALTSDYRYRGISQTRLKPALQGGADYTHNPSGFYAGTWLSTIKWIKDAGGDGSVEWDLYGGKRGEIAKDVSYDVGGLYYYYPSNSLATSANTFEIYGAIGYGPASLKYSHSTTNLFGFTDSKNSGYVDASYNQDVYDGYTLNLHVGHQKVKHTSSASYTDWKIGVTKDYGVVTLALAVIRADTDAYFAPNGKDLAKTGAVLTVSKTF